MKRGLLRVFAVGVGIALLAAAIWPRVWPRVWPRALMRVRLAAAAATPAGGISPSHTSQSPLGTLAQAEAGGDGPTVIEVNDRIVRENVNRLGVNLGGQTFFDSLQTLNNLIVRNPGFEGQQWQSVLTCGTPGVNSCTGGPNTSAWPAGFLDGGTYEVISGAANGATGHIIHSSASNDHVGSTIQFSADTPAAKAPAGADYLVVRKSTPGDPAAGWGPQIAGGATLTAEFNDLSPSTPGRQALRIDAHGPGQSVSLKSYFDTSEGRSYVQMRGPYTLRFRAKLISGNSRLGISMRRLWPGGTPLFSQDVALEDRWRDYTFHFTANEPRQAVGPVMFTIQVEGAEVLLDDVSVAESTPNGTAFRTAAVETLQRLKPGILRLMDNGQDFGNSLDNMLAPASARERSGFNLFLTRSEDTPIGLNDFLVLCAKIQADPWFTVPIGWKREDMAGLIEFLGGPVTTKYGAARAAHGHPEPWTKTFHTIHLELGNETWNTAFAGSCIPDPVAYAQRVTTMFGVARRSQWYESARFDLVADGQVVNTYLTQTLVEKADGMDTIDIAPYMFNTFDDDSSMEHIFGPMFAEPEMMDTSLEGVVSKQVETMARAKRPVKLAVYETNIDAVEGKVGQVSLDAVVPSVGAGIAAIDHMLLMLRDDGIVIQNTYELGGGGFHFTNTAGLDKNERSPVWSMVVDMGGATDRVRPEFLAQQMVNGAIRPTMLATKILGTVPIWDQPLSANDKVELKRAHEIQTFAFSDSKSNTLILLNLSRTSERPVGLAGPCVPRGLVTVETLTSDNITDSNEREDKVRIVTRQERDVVPGKSTITLPPFSMTVLSSSNQGCTPMAMGSR